MKNFSKILISNILLLSLSISFLNAQTIQVVNPGNAAASADEIVTLFNGTINVTETDIETFYNNLLGPSYNPNCDNPVASVESMDNTSASFEWTMGANADSTRVAFLRLTTNQIWYDVTHDDAITVNIPNDIYLFAFQSKCGADLGPLYIIILDKPIMLSSPTDCKCDHWDEIWDSPINDSDGTDEVSTIDWEPIDQFEKYNLKFYASESQIAYMTFVLQFDDNDIPQNISYSSMPNCLKNIDINSSETFFLLYDPDTDDEIGSLTFAVNGEFTFDPIDYGTGSVKLNRCLDPWQPRSQQSNNLPEQIQFTMGPNPFSSKVSINVALPTNENVSIFLLDALGNKIKTIKKDESMKAGNHRLEINLNELPVGMYTCILKTNEQTIPSKIIKVN